MNKRALGALVLGTLLLAGTATAWEIPLELKEHRGKAGYRYVSGGVPLLVGQAQKVTELRLLHKGKAVPAQFRVLARWWRADKSIRWVLVDFQTEFKPASAKDGSKAGVKDNPLQFVLTNAKTPAPAPKSKLTVSETATAITVITGPARFVVAKKGFNFLQSASVDADGDGKFAPGEEMLATTPQCGTVLEDAFKTKYYSSASTRSVTVIEKGPMRVRVRARGVHRAPAGKGYSKGLYSYDYFMDFYAGGTTVFTDLIIGNNFSRSIGTPVFEDASLIIKLKDPVTEFSMAGHKGAAQSGKLEKGQSACLYQDSNGAGTWEKCPGTAKMTVSGWRGLKESTSSFQGYKILKRAGGDETEISKGNQAAGTTHLKTARGGLIVHVRNFWQQFPKGVEAFGDGRVRVALFPREYKAVHFLEDASAKGHEIALCFYAKGRPGVYGAAPDAAKFGGAWESKVLPRPADIKHIAACGALADTGPFTVPTGGMTKTPNNRVEAYGSRMLSGDRLYGNAYGWQVFGERWRSCGGHSKHGARQPMKEDNYLYRWFVTGVPGWFLNGDARSRQFRDVRAYRIEDQDPFGFKGWLEFRARHRSEDWTRRPQPKDAEVTKYQGGRYSRTTWWLPNPAHMTMDLVYDRYLLMGDQRAFENMLIIAAHGGYYSSHYKNVHRATGWSWRACYRYWELTGDKRVEKLLKACSANFKGMVDAGEIKLPWRNRQKTEVNWWFTFVFCRAAALTALHTGDPDALHVCKKMAARIQEMRPKFPKGLYTGDFAEFYAVLYHLTGEEKYKTLGLGKDGGESHKRVTGGMKLPACAHWLLNQPPKGKKK